MDQQETQSTFKAQLLQPVNTDNGDGWAFVVLPKDASAKLPRRGRTSVEGRIEGKEFRALLEPDGQKSHWLKIDQQLLETTGSKFGDVVQFVIWAVDKEPEPEVPEDLQYALDIAPKALVVWNKTTTLARLDWIHWITSAKQEKTRVKRIKDACEMLAEGNKRVCCFDSSGFYSKAISAPDSINE